MIVESTDENRVREFMTPFARVGDVDVYPASTCVRAVAAGDCAATVPAVDDVVPAVDPEDACQRAIERVWSSTVRIPSTARRRSRR
jgi:hypothetical protein